MRGEVALLRPRELLTHYLAPQAHHPLLLLVEAEHQKLLFWMMRVMMRIPNSLDGVFKEILY